MQFDDKTDLRVLRDRLAQLGPKAGVAPDVSVVIPVNAQGDLGNVLRIAQDVSAYRGPATIELLFVVNNFSPGAPPAEIATFRDLGVRVVALPDIRRPGEAPGFSARIPGVRTAASEYVVLFDADCRVPDATAVINWYHSVLRSGAHAAYTPVAYYDFHDCMSVRTRFLVHHGVRWVKRNVFRIPTTRGSNYAVRRTAMLELYDGGLLADEMNVGPTFKQLKGHVAYSGRRALSVFTSGRMFRPGWRRILPYFMYRLRYNVRVLHVREGVAQVTGRRNDRVRRYVDNRPVRDG